MSVNGVGDVIPAAEGVEVVENLLAEVPRRTNATFLIAVFGVDWSLTCGGGGTGVAAPGVDPVVRVPVDDSSAGGRIARRVRMLRSTWFPVDAYHTGGGGGDGVVDSYPNGVVGGGGVVGPDLSYFVGGGGGGGVVGPDLSYFVGGGGGVVATDLSGAVGGGGVVAPDLSGGGGGGVFDQHLSGGGVVVPAMDGEGGGEYGVNEFVPAGRYDMILAPSDRTVLELPVDFGDYLHYHRGEPRSITVRERLDENSPRLVFDVRYRDNKHRAFVTKKTWSGFAAYHGLQAGDEISFEEHGDAFLLTAQRNGVALW